MPSPLVVRPAAASDWSAIWGIIREVAAAAETFAMAARPDEEETRRSWMTAPPGRVVVAERSGEVLGTANMYANRPHQGDHVASGSLMVAARARGSGLGRALVRDLIAWAAGEGSAAIQFNAVVETNHTAVALYRSEGFRVLGTAPGAFRHPRDGRVGLHIMWRDLP